MTTGRKMRKIILYIAQSLDGYIADIDGQVGWLEEIPNPDQSDYGYQQFYDSIDTTIMGFKTYEQVKSFDLEFPYAGKKNYVLTRKTNTEPDKLVDFVSSDLVDFFNKLKQSPGKNIWLIGGSGVNTFFLNNGLIDEMMVYTMPILIGDGIPLFKTSSLRVKLGLVESSAFNSGVIFHHYSVKN